MITLLRSNWPQELMTVCSVELGELISIQIVKHFFDCKRDLKWVKKKEKGWSFISYVYFHGNYNREWNKWWNRLHGKFFFFFRSCSKLRDLFNQISFACIVIYWCITPFIKYILAGWACPNLIKWHIFQETLVLVFYFAAAINTFFDFSLISS